MVPPDGYSKAKEGQVCKLKRSLYGLKHNSRQWNMEFTKHLSSFGFKHSQANNCLFIYNSNSDFKLLIVYVDDLLISSSSKELITELKHSLHVAFTIKDLGYAKYFLGLEIAQSSTGIYVNQRKYIYDIDAGTDLQHAKEARTPFLKVYIYRMQKGNSQMILPSIGD